MIKNRFTFLSPLPPETCVLRLKEAVDAPSLFGLGGEKLVIGKIKPASLQLRRRIHYRNSFQTVLTATIKAKNGGTVISGKMGMYGFVVLFLCIWFGGVLFAGGTIFLKTLFCLLTASCEYRKNLWIGLGAMPVMLLFGVCLVRIGRFFARAEAAFLREFLVTTLEARESTAS